MALQTYTRLGEAHTPEPRGKPGLVAGSAWPESPSRLERIGSWLYRAEDARAAALGLEIQVTRHGLGRSYRDPRWGRRPRVGESS